MATYKSDLVINDVVPDMLNAGETKTVIAKYTASAALAAASIIEMVPVKEDFVVLGMQVYFTAFGAARTLDIGETGVLADRYFDGLDVSSAGKADLFADGDAAYVVPKKYSAGDTIDVLVNTDTMPQDAVLYLVVTYKKIGVIGAETV